MRNVVQTCPKPDRSKDVVWHMEKPNGDPLCYTPKWWQNGAYHGKKTTENPKYVTCPKCLEIMKEKGVVINESA